MYSLRRPRSIGFLILLWLPAVQVGSQAPESLRAQQAKLAEFAQWFEREVNARQAGADAALREQLARIDAAEVPSPRLVHQRRERRSLQAQGRGPSRVPAGRQGLGDGLLRQRCGSTTTTECGCEARPVHQRRQAALRRPGHRPRVEST